MTATLVGTQMRGQVIEVSGDEIALNLEGRASRMRIPCSLETARDAGALLYKRALITITVTVKEDP